VVKGKDNANESGRREKEKEINRITTKEKLIK
jgi:hypothetical protein